MNDLAVHLDFETRSTTDLKKSGVYRYAQDPHTYPWGFKYRIGYGPVREWRPGWADPVDLLAHIANGGKVVAHNAGFERTIWNWVIRARICPHWPWLYIEQQDCTMARAASIAHPQDLDKLCNVLQTDHRKDREGHALMMKMAKPRTYLPDGTVIWWDEPTNVDRLMTYCGTDVLTETDVDARIPILTPTWQKVWQFDQRINDRGVCVDRKAITKLADIVEHAKKEADKTMRKLTNRIVPKCSNVSKIIEFLNARGIETLTLRKGDQDDLIFMAGVKNDQQAADVIQLRRSTSKTSTAKYQAMLKCMCSDDRIRGLLNFHGASTGRWAGRLVQPQNFPRVDPDDEILTYKIELLHRFLKDDTLSVRDVYEYLEMLFGALEPLVILSKALRSMIVAAPNKKLVGGDFANIEGRFNAWIAGETWKIEAFSAYDFGIGPDLYKVAYARSFGVPVESVGKGQKRQIGKVQELALGYQGGVGAFITMGDTYNVNPYDLSAPVQNAATSEQWDTVAAKYAQATDKKGLQEREWTAIKIVVDNWRAAHPNIVQSWWNYQDAAIEAVAAPGTFVTCGPRNNVGYYSDQRALWCQLPSGRMLCYANPELRTEEVVRINKRGEEYVQTVRKVKYEGTDSKTKQWSTSYLYGGLQCENIVQAGSCDLLVDAMFRVEERGFPVILTVHDEILSEPDADSELGEDEFSRVMAITGPEYEGLPVAVSAWEGERYLK